MKQTPWRIRGVLLFLFLAIIATFECLGLLAGFSSIPAQAQKLGISETLETVRRGVLAVLVLGVAVNAFATTTMIARRLPAWIRAYSRITAFWYGLYATALLVFGFLLPAGLQQRSLWVLGILYGACAGVCLFAGAQTVLELEKDGVANTQHTPV
jgi:hypothetical protein